jgi:hypothetical protein
VFCHALLFDCVHATCLLCVQAALEIRQLKDTMAAGENRVKELVQQVRH